MLITLSPHTQRTERRRATTALFVTAALMNAAMAAASPVSTIIAADRLGAAWGGVPNTGGIVGTGIGAVLLTRAATRWGRRASFAVGYAAATAGAEFAITAAVSRDVILLTTGMLLLGLGNAAALLSRYAAADLYPAQRRGFAIGIVVWAGAVGAVGGPLLLRPASDAVTDLGWVALSGPFLFASLATAVAGTVVLALPTGRAESVESSVPLRDLLRTPPARSALAVMVTAHVVMVAVMTAAPLEMHLHHQDLGLVGLALSTHTLGMFAPSPLTGWLLDRVGSRPVMVAGLITVVVATALAATTPHDQATVWATALFLLGYGWNLCFIGGSGRLASGLPAPERARVEGAVDASVWGVAATASLASTAVLSTGGYALLVGVAGSLVVLPAVALFEGKQWGLQKGGV